MQSFILYLSDAFDTDACAPVRSKNIFTFWSMSIHAGSRISGVLEGGRIEKKIYYATLPDRRASRTLSGQAVVSRSAMRIGLGAVF